MSKFDKLVEQILDGRPTSYKEAESVLTKLGFELRIRGSHHVFAKPDYNRNVSIKIRTQLLPYQIRLIQEVLKDYGY
jgi:predicted RNA binding protein YcfA (HicA-like mRNA interferase family)